MASDKVNPSSLHSHTAARKGNECRHTIHTNVFLRIVVQNTSAGRQDRPDLEPITSQIYEKITLFYLLAVFSSFRFVVRTEARHPSQSPGPVKDYISTERQHEGIDIR